jgi:murein tripeptide amidase MpaA
MPYLNVAQVESAVQAYATLNPTFTQLINLPHATHEGRACRALKIASGGGSDRIGVYFIGGVHAREWGNPDILIHFIQQLTQAYRLGTGVALGGKSFTAAQIQDIVKRLDLFVFPQVNPDGRNYSMVTEAMWRKNRRGGLGTGTGCPGVDINRNYDFLWNFPTYFHPSAGVMNSTTTCGPPNSFGYSLYIGPAAASEPETRNVVWMVDANPNIRFFIDLHHYSELILYGWGDDEAQTTDPNMNFRNPAYNGMRGLAGDAAYREYIDACDQTASLDLANRLRNAVQAVRGRAYTVQPSFNLYPTAGTSTDYMYSRHIVDRARGKVHAFTIESGSGANPTPFHPPYAEMQNIINEVTAGLLDFCLGILAMHADVYVRDNAADTGSVPSTGPFWASPDVVVRQTDDGVVAYEPAKRGQKNWLYVQLTNRGPNTTREVRVSARAVRFPGTEFVYPHDWTTIDSTHFAPTPITASFTAVPSGATRVAKFELSTAQVNALWGWQSGGWHPCLLAAADGCTDFGSPAGPHVWQNNNLGQRNISIVPASLLARISFPFLVAHELREDRHVTIRIDREGLPEQIELLLDVAPRDRPFPRVKTMRIDPEQAVESVLSLRGAEFVKTRWRPMVSILEPEATVLLVSEPGLRRHLTLRLRIPKDAEPGEEYSVHVSQVDDAGDVVGGVSLLAQVEREGEGEGRA